MASIPFHYVDLRTFCYATEAGERVETALRTLLPREFPIERDETESHFGAPIVVLSARVEKADDVRAVLDRLNGVALDQVRAELDDRVDEKCALHLRVDKQAAYRGEVRLGAGITVRAKVEAYPAKRETAIENAREALAP